jgi:hypothetical protein
MDNGITFLTQLVINGSVDKIQQLVNKKYVDLNAPNDIIGMMINSDDSQFDQRVEQITNNMSRKKAGTAECVLRNDSFIIACMYGNNEIIRTLIEGGCNVTSNHLAVYLCEHYMKMDYELVTQFIDHGASLIEPVSLYGKCCLEMVDMTGYHSYRGFFG